MGMHHQHVHTSQAYWTEIVYVFDDEKNENEMLNVCYIKDELFKNLAIVPSSAPRPINQVIYVQLSQMCFQISRV